MTLKERMEIVWEKYPIACPLHLARWSVSPKIRVGSVYRWYKGLGSLFYRKGTPSPPIPRKNAQERWK